MASVRQYPLYNGTADRNLVLIRELCLDRGVRHHVHLSSAAATARAVGARHGRPIVLAIRAAELHQAGVMLSHPENGVWLVDRIPSNYLDFPI